MEHGQLFQIKTVETSFIDFGIDEDGNDKYGGEVLVVLEDGQKIVFTCDTVDKMNQLSRGLVQSKPIQVYTMPKRT